MQTSTEQEKKHILSYVPQEIVAFFPNEPAFRAKQIFKWLSKNIKSFDEMTNISPALRQQLTNDFFLFSSIINQKLEDSDGTVKLQIQLYDKACIEAVLLTDIEGRKTACLSSQVGCAMACTFCQTAKLGFLRNLCAGEIIEQVLFLEQIAEKIDNFVFMGMGEPLDNLAEVRKAIQILTHPEGANFSKRRFTLSTSGLIKQIYDLADNGPDIKLAVSLTSANAEKRQKLMPIAKTNNLFDLQKAIQYYTEKTNSRCTIEIPLLSGVNTDDEAIKELVQFCADLSIHINLIPWNKVEGISFSEPTQAEIKKIMQKLEKANIPVTLRAKRGRKIGGACGQLGKTTTN
ncbi:MAG: 23S rRNA (adenine(2503)-C(2))-methyltransferase RlmN [Treponemataceae bacterium]